MSRVPDFVLDLFPTPPPGAFTVKDVVAANKAGVKERDVLKKLTSDPRLESDLFSHNGRMTRFFWERKGGK